MLLAFTIAAWVTFLLVTLAYFFVQDGIPSTALSRLDHDLIAVTQNIKAGLNELIRNPIALPGPISLEALQKTAIMLSDQQLVTGTGILVVGYYQHCSITQYHFDVVSELAWLSFTVHQATVLVLSDYLIKNRALCHWRVIWMTCFAGMLLVSLLPTGSSKWLWFYGSPTQCIFDHMKDDYWGSNTVTTLIYMGLLIWGLVNTLGSLYPLGLLSIYMSYPDRAVQAGLRSPSKLHQLVITQLNQRKIALSLVPHQNTTLDLRALFYRLWGFIAVITWSLLAAFTYVAFFVSFSISEIISSCIFDFVRILVSLMAGTESIYELKAGVYSDGGMIGSESGWSFGQVLPLLLLALPIFAVLEIYYGKLRSQPLRYEDSYLMQLEAYVGSHSKSDTPGPREERVQENDTAIVMPSLVEEPSSLYGEGTSRVHPYSRGIGILRRRSSQYPSRADTEQRIGDTDPRQRGDLFTPGHRDTYTTVKDDDVASAALEDALYKKPFFKVWLSIISSGLFMAIIFGSLQGFPI